MQDLIRKYSNAVAVAVFVFSAAFVATPKMDAAIIDGDDEETSASPYASGGGDKPCEEVLEGGVKKCKQKNGKQCKDKDKVCGYQSNGVCGSCIKKPSETPSTSPSTTPSTTPSASSSPSASYTPSVTMTPSSSPSATPQPSWNMY